ncbi:MAG: MgtC/SapB family protein [Burkholderiales bacterium]|nr:MgtC/SapB family protein [Burkholderiales bacterium]
MNEGLAGDHFGDLVAIGTALAIGLLIGVERERNPWAKAGIRTFALVAVFGALSAIVAQHLDSGWIVAAGIGVVGAMIVAAYHRDTAQEADPGTTTVIALLVAYLLGVLTALGERQVAVMIAIATTVLLYFKPEMRGALERFSRRDLLSVLQFAVITFIVLPFLPDAGHGPYGALNPYRIWLMVVLVAGIGLAGYIALRLVGGTRGALYVGFFGGLVSSTATTLAYSRVGTDPAARPLATRVILIANLVVLARVVVVASFVSGGFATKLAPVLGAAIVVGALLALAFVRRDETPGDIPVPETANPTELREAVGFGALFAAVLVLSAWLNDIAGAKGLYLVAAASGLTDVDAITLSTGSLLEQGATAPRVAVLTVAVALVSNQIVKLAFVLLRGGLGLFRVVGLPMAVTGLTVLAAALLAP